MEVSYKERAGQSPWPRVMRCVVKDCCVVLQVFPEPPSCDADVPLDDPFEHPFPTPLLQTKVSPGALPLPDPLELTLKDFEDSSCPVRKRPQEHSFFSKRKLLSRRRVSELGTVEYWIVIWRIEMLTRCEAAEIARSLLKMDDQSSCKIPLALYDEWSYEYPFGWLFFWGPDPQWAASQEKSENCQLDGNGPILVDRRNGSAQLIGSGFDFEVCAERYWETGSPY